LRPPLFDESILAVGDSKTVWMTTPYTNWWPALLETLMDAVPGYRWWEWDAIVQPSDTYAMATSGFTAGDMLAVIDARLAAYPSYTFPPTRIFVNFGANDCKSAGAIAAYEANMESLVDKLHAKWPNALIYLTRAWRRGYDMSIFDGFDTNIDNIIADGRTAYCFLGDDERVWLENGDDGATYTTDGVHYTLGARPVKAAALKAAMGF